MILATIIWSLIISSLLIIFLTLNQDHTSQHLSNPFTISRAHVYKITLARNNCANQVKVSNQQMNPGKNQHSEHNRASARKHRFVLNKYNTTETKLIIVTKSRFKICLALIEIFFSFCQLSFFFGM